MMHRYSFGPSRVVTHPPGAFLLSFITITIAVTAFVFTLGPSDEGSATLLVRNLDGTRSLAAMSMQSGALTPLSADASAVVAQGATYPLPDGTVVALDTPGIVQRIEGEAGTTRVLVSSPVPPTIRTPLAVWGSGERIAWVNPADDSLQVFAWDGTAYQPLRVFSDTVQSIGFIREDLIVGTRLVGSQTIISTFDLYSGTVTERATLDGLISIVTP